MIQLGQLQKIDDLRIAWESEPEHFTPWLANNLKLLGDTIGIELELESQEKEVGPFNADILCKDMATNNWVLIENQLERTDHTHLGQLMTYAAGLNAVTIVWIAERFTDEHRAAMDWLNEHTDEKINLFGLEIELWRVNDSLIAPKFNIVCKPNDWFRTVRNATEKITPAKQIQLRFWTQFKEYLESNKSFLKRQKPGMQHWYDHTIGRSGIKLSSIINIKPPEIRAEFQVNHSKAKDDFAKFEKQRESIERSLGFELVWHNPDNATACRCYIKKSIDLSSDETLWPECFAWLREHLEKMHKVFAPLVKQL